MRQIPTTIKNQKLVEKRREQILLAAIRLFSRKGFHKTNLRELAEEAGLSAGNIYDYVSSKEDIFYLIHSPVFIRIMPPLGPMRYKSVFQHSVCQYPSVN